MAIKKTKITDGTTFNDPTDIKVHNGSTWVSTTKVLVFNGSSWDIVWEPGGGVSDNVGSWYYGIDEYQYLWWNGTTEDAEVIYNDADLDANTTVSVALLFARTDIVFQEEFTDAELTLRNQTTDDTITLSFTAVLSPESGAPSGTYWYSIQDSSIDINTFDTAEFRAGGDWRLEATINLVANEGTPEQYTETVTLVSPQPWINMYTP